MILGFMEILCNIFLTFQYRPNLYINTIQILTEGILSGVNNLISIEVLLNMSNFYFKNHLIELNLKFPIIRYSHLRLLLVDYDNLMTMEQI